MTLAQRQNVRIEWDNGAPWDDHRVCTVTYPSGKRLIVDRHCRRSMVPVKNGPLFYGDEKYQVRGEEAEYQNLEILIEERQPKVSEANALIVAEFNALLSGHKWDTYKSMSGVWLCSSCGENVGKPQRCSPFPGATIHCSMCDGVLTRRTGGGQSDPFGWLLSVENQA